MLISTFDNLMIEYFKIMELNIDHYRDSVMKNYNTITEYSDEMLPEIIKHHAFGICLLKSPSADEQSVSTIKVVEDSLRVIEDTLEKKVGLNKLTRMAAQLAALDPPYAAAIGYIAAKLAKKRLELEELA